MLSLLDLYKPILKSNSFIAAVLKTKFIHMGRIKSIRTTFFHFIFERARIYATGYATKRHITVVIIAKPKLTYIARILAELPKK